MTETPEQRVIRLRREMQDPRTLPQVVVEVITWQDTLIRRLADELGLQLEAPPAKPRPALRLVK